MDFQITTAVWGRSYIEEFFTITLPSMLAAGNLPAVAASGKGRYTIYTREQDEPLFRNSELMARVRALLPVELVYIRQALLEGNPHIAHGRAWYHAATEARKRKELIFFAPPDVVWSSRSIGKIFEALREGFKAVSFPSVRVVPDVLLDRVMSKFRRADGVIDATPRELVGLSLDCLAPLTSATLRENDHYSLYPEQVAYYVPREGVVLASPLTPIYAFDPVYCSFGESLQEGWDSGYRVFDDSDDVFFLSLAAPEQQADWYLAARPYSPLEHALTVQRLPASQIYTEMTRSKYLFHAGETDSPAWRRAIGQARMSSTFTMIHLKILRVLELLKEAKLAKAADLLVLATTLHRFHRHWKWHGPISVLAPSDAALEPAYAVLRDGAPEKLVSFLLRCVVPADLEAQPASAPVTNVFGETLIGNSTDLATRCVGSDPDPKLAVKVFSVSELPFAL